MMKTLNSIFLFVYFYDGRIRHFAVLMTKFPLRLSVYIELNIDDIMMGLFLRHTVTFPPTAGVKIAV